VLLGNGDGTFQPAVSYSAGSYLVSLSLSDVTGDSKPDLAAVGENGVSVLMGQEKGAFSTAVDFHSGPNSISVETADFNNDGQPDLAVANYNPDGTVSVLLNACVTAGVSLAIVRNNNTVTISWPFPSAGFDLESTMSLNPTDWQIAAEVPTNDNARWTVIVAHDQAKRYFRLHKQ
jgi:FG-GAP-like repeat